MVKLIIFQSHIYRRVRVGQIGWPSRWWTFRRRRWSKIYRDDFFSFFLGFDVRVLLTQYVSNLSVGLCAAIFLQTSLCHFEIFSQGAARPAYKKKWQTGVRLSINSIITHHVQSNPPPSLLLILLAMFCHVLRTSLRDESDGVDKDPFCLRSSKFFAWWKRRRRISSHPERRRSVSRALRSLFTTRLTPSTRYHTTTLSTSNTNTNTNTQK